MKLVFGIGLLACLSSVKGMGEWCKGDKSPCPELEVAVNHFYHWTVKHMMDEMVTYVHPTSKMTYVVGHHICSDYEANEPEVFKFHKKVSVSKTITAELSVVTREVEEEYHCYYFPGRGNNTWTIQQPFGDGTKLNFLESMQKDMEWADYAEKVGEEQARQEFKQIEGNKIPRMSLGNFWNRAETHRAKDPKEPSELTTGQQDKATDLFE
ncbi:hypothetical protein IWQ62_000376 [Dispira parvispora]|uniref:Uncharacterized protein n=1 Tax=Dispira parvispora TaxID=1520584 RepID=A0A9W8AW22_9FUNG|nr:hypothetical protein IWQ62_000376 [Dispira parvispora]